MWTRACYVRIKGGCWSYKSAPFVFWFMNIIHLHIWSFSLARIDDGCMLLWHAFRLKFWMKSDENLVCGGVLKCGSETICIDIVKHTWSTGDTSNWQYGGVLSVSAVFVLVNLPEISRYASYLSENCWSLLHFCKYNGMRSTHTISMQCVVAWDIDLW